MTANAHDGLPVLHTPEEVAKQLGRSGWWVREQCRRERFPHTRAGGAIRFTHQQFEEILQILECRPGAAPQTARPSGGGRRHTSKVTARPSTPQLRARPPRKPRPVGSLERNG